MDPRKLGLSDDDLEALGYRVRPEAPGTSPGDASRQGPSSGQSPVATRTARAARSWFWTAFVLLVATWALSADRQRPAPVPANSADSVFSSGRAMSQLVEVVGAPRPLGSPEHDRVRVYLEERLRSLGLEPETQVVTVTATDSGSATSASIHNVVARLSGAASSGAVLMTAHYDGFPLSAGGGDNGIGIASILETLRVVQAGPQLQNDLIVLFADGQEVGGFGTRAFAEQHEWMSDVAFVVSLEMRGVSGPAWAIETEAGDQAPIQTLSSATRRALAHSLSLEVGADLAGAGSLGDQDVQGLHFVGLGGRGAHHQSLDVAERVSERTLAHHGTQLLALTRELGQVDFGAPSTSDAGPRAYVSLIGAGVIDYPLGWSLLFTIGLALGWTALALTFRLRGGSPRRLLAGTLVAALAVAAAAAAGQGMVELLRRLHPEYGRVAGAVFNDGIHVAALATVAVGIVVLVYGTARTRFTRAELYLGALVLPFALLVWVTVQAPSAAPALQLPLVCALILGAFVVVAFPDRLGTSWAWRGTLALSVCILAVTVPSLEWIVAVLTPREGVTIGAAIAMGGLLLLPAADWLLAPRIWWTPAVALVSATVMVVAALPGVRGEIRHPELTSLILLADDTMSATRPSESPPTLDSLPTTLVQSDVQIRRVPGQWLTVRGPGEEWARSWAVPGAVSGREPGDLFLPDGVDWEVAGAGTAPELARPVVEVLADTVMNGLRQLRIVVHPGLDGEMIGLLLADDAAGRVIAVEGLALGSPDEATPVRRIAHWGRSADNSATFDLEFTVASGPVMFDLIEHHLRPAELLGAEFFERDRTVIPDASTGSDRVIQRMRVRIGAEQEPGGITDPG